VLYLSAHATTLVDYHTFHAEPFSLTVQGEPLIALGLLVLIATPIARVVLLLIAFVARRDRVYTAITVAVLTVLLISLGVSGR
jgi:uncharacterized membrane protein